MFFGHDGLDELTVTTTSTIYELEHGDVRISDFDPLDFGIPHAELGALAGGDAAGNAQAVHQVFAGRRARSATSWPSTPRPRMVVGDVVPDLAAGVELAGAVIDDGRPRRRWKRWCGSRWRHARAGSADGPRPRVPGLRARHRIDTLPDAPTFRCDRCGQVLKVPTPVSSSGSAGPPPPARQPGPATGRAAAATRPGDPERCGRRHRDPGRRRCARPPRCRPPSPRPDRPRTAADGRVAGRRARRAAKSDRPRAEGVVVLAVARVDRGGAGRVRDHRVAGLRAGLHQEGRRARHLRRHRERSVRASRHRHHDVGAGHRAARAAARRRRADVGGRGDEARAVPA